MSASDGWGYGTDAGGQSDAPRYCVECGRSLVDGACPEHDAIARPIAVLPAPAPPPPSARRRRWPSVAIILVLLAALVASALYTRALDHRLSDSTRELHARDASAERRFTTVGKQLHDAQSANEALAARLAKLERRSREGTSVAAKVDASVFTVETDFGLGSGWVAKSDGVSSAIVTNYHVIADVYEAGIYTVKVVRGDETFRGTISETDADADLAVISVHESFPPLGRASREADVGETVYAVGSPLGLGNTVTSGIVSAYRDRQGQRWLQFSAPISPGNSGGPVVDGEGNVLGVSSRKFVSSSAEALGFAIPVAEVCDRLTVC